MTIARAAFTITVALVLSLVSAIGCSGAAPTATPTPSAAFQYTNVTTARAKELIATSQDLTILDVRMQSEYDSGHIAGARLIPVTELEGRLDGLERSKPILVYCRTGTRSLQASQILTRHQFEHVYNMMGGIEAWAQAKYPLTQ